MFSLLLAALFGIGVTVFIVWAYTSMVKADKALHSTWREVTGTELSGAQLASLHRMARIERNKQRIA